MRSCSRVARTCSSRSSVPERTAIGLVRIRQASGLVEQYDEVSQTWHVVPDARFAEALAQRRLDPTRGVALARARGVLQGS